MQAAVMTETVGLVLSNHRDIPSRQARVEG